MAGAASAPRMTRPNLASLARVWSCGLSAHLRTDLGTSEAGTLPSHALILVFVGLFSSAAHSSKSGRASVPRYRTASAACCLWSAETSVARQMASHWDRLWPL